MGLSLALCHQIGALSRTAAFQMKLAGELRVLIAAAGLAARLQACSPLSACSARRSRPGSSPQRARRWPCLRPTPKPARTPRPSSSAWPGSKPAALPEPPALPTRALADDCRAQSRAWRRRRGQGCCARASRPRCQRAMSGAAMTSPRPEPYRQRQRQHRPPDPRPHLRQARSASARPTLGQQRRNSHCQPGHCARQAPPMPSTPVQTRPWMLNPPNLAN